MAPTSDRQYRKPKLARLTQRSRLDSELGTTGLRSHRPTWVPLRPECPDRDDPDVVVPPVGGTPAGDDGEGHRGTVNRIDAIRE